MSTKLAQSLAKLTAWSTGEPTLILRWEGYLPNTLLMIVVPHDLTGFNPAQVRGVTIAATGKTESCGIYVSITGIAINTLALASCLSRPLAGQRRPHENPHSYSP